MIEEAARALAREIENSPEAQAYQSAKETAMGESQTAALLERFLELRQRLQARQLLGTAEDAAEQQEFSKLGELLQFYPLAAQFLRAEYDLQGLLSRVYAILAEASLL